MNMQLSHMQINVQNEMLIKRLLSLLKRKTRLEFKNVD